MARLTIQLTARPDHYERVIAVAYRSDEDATPSEHEHVHRGLVARLLPGVDLDRKSRPGVAVERDKPAVEPMSCGSCGGDDYEVIDLG